MQAAAQIDRREIDALARERARERLRALERSERLWRADLPTFAEDALIIRPKVAAPQKFRLNSVQRKLHADLENLKAETGRVRAIILKARQMGVSTYVGARFYHRMRHDPGYRSLIMTHREDASEGLAEMVFRYYENDPEPPDTRVNSPSDGELVFANTSGVRVMVAGPVKTGAGRSHTFQLQHLSEVAYWSNASEHMSAVLRTLPNVEGSEGILESTANGTNGVFYAMAMGARQGLGRWRLLFYPWMEHDEYATPPPPGWQMGDHIREMAERLKLTPERAYWAEQENTDMAIEDGEPVDEICWRFRQEYPSTIDEAFRAGRKGGYIKSSEVTKAQERTNPHQPDMPLVIGCDFATGGGGQNSEYTLASQLTGTAADTRGQGVDDGDSNVFISHQGWVKGGELYERFKDRDSVSVANKLQAIIVRLRPDRVFMDAGGGGAQVFDTLCDRGYGRVLELVDFGGTPVDDRKYRNKRAEMHGEFREWLKRGAIPDDDVLESEITSVWAVRDDENGLLLAPKREVRQKLKTSPDGLDACVLCHAAPVRLRSGSVGVSSSRGRR